MRVFILSASNLQWMSSNVVSLKSGLLCSE